MKTTVQLDAALSISVHNSQLGVKVDLRTYGVSAMNKVLTLDQARVLGQALLSSADLVERAEAASA